jgi:hypothetical protein
MEYERSEAEAEEIVSKHSEDNEEEYERELSMIKNEVKREVKREVKEDIKNELYILKNDIINSLKELQEQHKEEHREQEQQKEQKEDQKEHKEEHKEEGTIVKRCPLKQELRMMECPLFKKDYKKDKCCCKDCKCKEIKEIEFELFPEEEDDCVLCNMQTYMILALLFVIFMLFTQLLKMKISAIFI